ncbi:MAG: hypothetical protein HKN10_16250, partial [Myxococcales bacterium]|nr:hypothetical protein [Myxococcales bacterium]
MTEISRNLARRAFSATSLALVVLVSWSQSAAAEESTAEETAAAAAAAASEEPAAELAGEPAVPDLIVVPGGVPAEPMDPNT